MQAQRFKAKSCVEVCIFCTTRIQFASARSHKRLQRRFFSQIRVLKKPPGAAAAAQRIHDEKDFDQSNSPGDAQRSPSRWNEAWMYRSESRATQDGDTQGYKRIRTNLDGKRIPESKQSPFRPLADDNSRPLNLYKTSEDSRNRRGSRWKPVDNQFRPDWFCMSCGASNFSKRRECVHCKQPAPEITDWKCGKCGNMNESYKQQCTPCSQALRFSESGVRESDVNRGWKHLRKTGPVSSQNPYDSASAPVPPAPKLTWQQEEIAAQARAAEVERGKRWKEAEDGKFVGFNKDQAPRTSTSFLDSSHVQAYPSSRSLRMGSFQSSDAASAWTRPEPKLSPRKVARTPSPMIDEPTATDQIVEREPSVSFDPSFLEDDRQQRKPKRFGDRYENRAAPHDRNRHKARKSGFLRGHNNLDEDDDDQVTSKQERKEQRKKAKEGQKLAAAPTPIYLPEFISVSNLAGVLRVRVEDFLKKMQDLGFDDLQNDHVLDAETAGLIAAEFNFEAIIEDQEDHDLKPRHPAEDKSILPARPPVVTIMGHVDHGKTTLLDYLRKSSVAASEHGGITQHIGAFSVPMPGGRLVTFLDTPGHAAFLAMRQRGANVTDIVILVVAADDSVKSQTIEAIKHAQSAKVPMIVAINKIDKEDSNIDRVKQDLARYGVEIEDYGGDTQVVCVSGKTGQGLDELEDAAVALADIIDMRAETDGPAEGWILEATTKKAGRVATVLVRRGTLRPGNVIVAGTSWARVRGLRNEAGVVISYAGPGTPVEVDGWREQPAAGDEMLQAPDEQKAKSVIEYRMEALGRAQMATDIAAVNESRRIGQEKREQLEKAKELAAAQAEGTAATDNVQPEEEKKAEGPSYEEVFFILKADVSGSLEAVTNAVSALGNSEVRPNILRSGVGAITEFDVDHAAVAQGYIISFNTNVDASTRREAEEKGVSIIDESIIYRLVDNVKAVLAEKLPSVTTQKVIGEAEIAQVFEINTKGRVTVPVAGCRVRNGALSKGAKVRVLRGKEVIYDGTLSSLKNMKKDVTEMRKGTECGIGFEDWFDFKAGDQVQTYEESVEKRTL